MVEIHSCNTLLKGVAVSYCAKNLPITIKSHDFL